MATHFQNQQWVLLMKYLRRRSIQQLKTFKDKLQFFPEPKYSFIRTIGIPGNFLSTFWNKGLCAQPDQFSWQFTVASVPGGFWVLASLWELVSLSDFTTPNLSSIPSAMLIWSIFWREARSLINRVRRLI